MSSSYYGRVKTRDEILQELKASINKNLEVLNDALLYKTDISGFVTDVHGVKICDLKDSIFDSVGLSGNNILNNYDIVIDKKDKIYNDFNILLNHLGSINKYKDIFDKKFSEYIEKLSFYDIQSPQLLKKYNEFMQKIKTIIGNERIVFSSQLALIDEEFTHLYEYLETHNIDHKLERNTKEINDIFKKIYSLDIDLNLSNSDDCHRLIDILEERYVDETIKLVLDNIGYSHSTILNINSINGDCYKSKKIINNLFIANDEDKLIIESIYENDIYNNIDNEQLIENMKISCLQNELFIKELEKYGLIFDLLYKEEPSLENISIIQNEKEKKLRSLKRKKEKYING